jgi:hypothetical protein
MPFGKICAYALKHLDAWTTTERIHTPLVLQPGHVRVRHIGRQDDKRAGDLDLYAQPNRSGAAGTGAARPGAGAVGRLRL